jgi:hypothetical protein
VVVTASAAVVEVVVVVVGGVDVVVVLVVVEVVEAVEGVGAGLIVKVNAEKHVPPNRPEVKTVTLAVPAVATSALEICACN